MIKAVIFDLYETLITEFDPDFEPPKRSLAEQLGISQERFQARFDSLSDEWEIGKIGGFEELLNRVCEGFAREVPPALINELVSERSAVLVGFENIDSAIVEMIREIISRGMRVGVVTNVSNLDLGGWPESELAPLIQHLVPSFEVGVMKPDPLIYRRCLEALGVEAGDTVYVGDGGNDELAGADQVGMTPFWATWFLERWPHGIRPGARFDGDEWRQFSGHEPPYPRMDTPGKFLQWLLAER